MRRIRRAGALAIALVLCLIRYRRMRLRSPLSLEERAQWMQAAARSALHSLGVELRVEGQAPERGLLIANHLSYFDIAVLSAAVPCSFVARLDVGGWPFFGTLARCGGTIFLDRSSMSSAKIVASEITERLQRAVPIVIFAEGTSTDGTQVLPFRSRLMYPATQMGAPITAAALRYVFKDGPAGPVAEREACWYGHASFLPHLWKVLGQPAFSARVRFGVPQIYSDRRSAAEITHAEIETMRAEAWRP